MAPRLRTLLRYSLSLLGAAAGWLGTAPRALAHTGLTGQHTLSEYGALVFVLAVVLVCAGVAVWAARSDGPADDEAA